MYMKIGSDVIEKLTSLDVESFYMIGSADVDGDW